MIKQSFPEIRPFRIDDIHQILDIEKQAFPKTAYSKETLFHFAKSLLDNFVVIEWNKEIVGYIIFEDDGHILSTAVKKSYRRKGLGRNLFLHASKYTKNRLWLEVRTKNEGAIAFYEKMGMHFVGKVSKYYGTDDALIMRMPPDAT